mmetsp:Transcript_28252/g.32376  ORF Transcript_28252/g.32376 Transcript_28252/m.32376 type:complete len:99 (-) Transcript_28252:163-459(-)
MEVVYRTFTSVSEAIADIFVWTAAIFRKFMKGVEVVVAEAMKLIIDELLRRAGDYKVVIKVITIKKEIVELRKHEEELKAGLSEGDINLVEEMIERKA